MSDDILKIKKYRNKKNGQIVAMISKKGLSKDVKDLLDNDKIKSLRFKLMR